jgi:hypothetical protein
MAVAPEPYFSACLQLLFDAILACRAGHWSEQFSHEHTADLMDAIHNIPSMIQNWETVDVEYLRAGLTQYERKWLAKGGVALCQIFDDAVAGECS